MGWVYFVFAALAVLGLALGWRFTPAPDPSRRRPEGVARLLQLAIAGTGLAVLVLLLLPWYHNLAGIRCTVELERAGHCVLGVYDRGLFGAAAFVCLVGAAFAFILRKGVLDFPLPWPEPVDTALGRHADGVGGPGADEPEPEADDEKPEPEADEPVPVPVPGEPEPVPEPVPKAERKASEPEPEPEADDEKPEAPAPSGGAASHRRLEGPVFQAFVDDTQVDLEAAIRIAVERLRSERVAVVFSLGASKNANLALAELAEAFDAHRYVLEGTAAATEGLLTEDTPDPNAVLEIAGKDAKHAFQLALDLAGGFIQTVMLLDTRVAFPEFVLGKLTELQSVCIAHAHDAVSAACQVMLPGTNPGEREGQLIDAGGGENSRRPREWLVRRMVEVLHTAQGEASERSPSDDDLDDDP